MTAPTVADIWHTCGVPTNHPTQPSIRREVEDYGAWVEMQLDPAVIVAAVLDAVGTPTNRAHAAAYRQRSTPEARADHLAAIAADSRVITACRLMLSLPVAEQLADDLAEAALEPEACSVRSCERYAAWGGTCHAHGG